MTSTASSSGLYRNGTATEPGYTDTATLVYAGIFTQCAPCVHEIGAKPLLDY